MGKRPVFVIKFGPPASGKSTVDRECGVHKIDTHVGINDYVERNKGFVEESMSLARSTNARFDNKLAKRGFDVYQKYRRLYDNQHDHDLKRAVQQRQNVSFETTGTGGFPNWLWTHLDLSAYDVVLMFPVVPAATAYQRYVQRAKRMLADKKGVRFGSTYPQFLAQYIKIYENFLNGYTSFVAKHNVKVYVRYQNRCRLLSTESLLWVARELFEARSRYKNNDNKKVSPV